MRLSVIVPIYNTQEYLRECLDSILSEPIDEMEVICVNDGSKDQSLFIMKEIAVKDQRVKVIDKQNSGYGDTINVGLAAATGKYVSILESDDKTAQGALIKLLTCAEEQQADVVKGNYYNWFSEHDSVELYDNLKAFSDGELVKGDKRTELFFVAPSLWSAVYRTEFLRNNEIYFLPTPGASYQDTSFVFKVWACAERVVTVKDPVVFYRQDNNSSSSNDTGKEFCICEEFREIERFIMQKGLENTGPIFARVKYISYFWNVNRLCPEKKTEFLDAVYEELCSLKENGWLVKQLWKEDDWLVINSCISHFEEFKRALREGKDIWTASRNVSEITS